MGNRRAAAVLLAAALAAACTGDDDPASTPSATTVAPRPTEAEAPTTTTSGLDDQDDDHDEDEDEGIGDLEAVLPTLLIAAAELGDPTLVDLGYAPQGDERCGEPVAATGTSVGAPGGVTITEELRAYADPAAAAEAFGRCVPSPGTDVTAEVGGDVAVEGPEGYLAQVADVLVGVRFTGAGGPDRREVAAFAVGKVIAFLEAGAGG